MVLVLVLLVIAMLSLAGFTFSELMLSERKAAHVAGQQAQTRALADSGLEMARFFLTQTEDVRNQDGGAYDNAERFRGVLVTDNEDGQGCGRFAIVAPSVESGDTVGIRFGLEDESTRLNLSTLALADKAAEGSAREILMGLPNMTEQIADAIMDWIDPDDETREFGAEVDYYGSLVPGYAPKNGPLETVEELLLVRDVTPWLLFGSDANRNGLPDSLERSINGLESGSAGMDDGSGRGWASYLTLYSLESNLRPDGEPRVYLNQTDVQKLNDELTEVLDEQSATFIVAYRQNGPYTGSKKATQGAAGELDLTTKPKREIATVLELIGAKVEVTFSGAKQSTILESPFADIPGVMSLYLPKLMDNVTATKEKVIPGRININQAPRTVLEGIPGMTSEIVEQIISNRTPDPALAAQNGQENRRHETWILADGIVTLAQMKALMPFVTGGGSVYRAQVVGYFDQGGPATRIEVVLDATKQPPKMVFWRDLSHLGRGFALETLGIEAPQ